VFRLIDSGRAFLANQLNKGIEWSKAQINGPQKSSAFQNSTPQKSGGVWAIVGTVLLSVFSALLYLVGHAAIFYPILAVLFLYLMWKGFKWFRRR
jgi:hypothetical protein